MTFLLLLAAFLFAPDLAHAGPVATVVALMANGVGFGAAMSATFGALGMFALRLAATIGLSALARAAQKQPRPPGIQTDYTQQGGTNPASFILGKYATAGTMICPPPAHGEGPNDTPNAWLTYVVNLADMPGHGFSRLMINGEYVTLEASESGDYGRKVLGKYLSDGEVDYGSTAWLRFYDGSQTAADPYLLAKYGAHPERPWTSAMVGRGMAYAILTFLYDRALFTGLPEVRFELLGPPLYDPRKDSSVGGSGSQRWATPSTWARTDNPVVMIYNILRGIDLPGGMVWGGDCAAEDLPLANWFTAMNVCDEPVTLNAGGTQPRYRAGFEVKVADDEPAAVIEELLKACAGTISEIGGAYKIRAGGPGLPVFSFTDGDLLITLPQDYTPFRGLDEAHNAVSATYPEPGNAWEQHNAPPISNAAFKAEDQGRQLVADLSLPAVPYGRQVGRLMQAWLKDSRRGRWHNLPFGPYAAMLEPLDVAGWTSARNGYVGKAMEIEQVSIDLVTCVTSVAARECDPSDYDWSPSSEILSAVPSSGWSLPPETGVPAWAVTGTALKDAANASRRPALLLTWDGTGQRDARGLAWEIRLAGATTAILRGSMQTVAAGALIVAEGILPATAYQARGRILADRRTVWSDWEAATTPNVKLGPNDLSYADITAQVNEDLDELADWVVTETGTLADDILTNSNALAAQQTLIDGVRATLSDASLIPNGELIAGATSMWFSVPSQFGVLARGANGNNSVINAPTPYIVSMEADTATRQMRLTGSISCKEGEVFEGSLAVAGSGTGFHAVVSIMVYWQDATGTQIGSPNVLATSGIKTTIGWGLDFKGTATAPAGAAKAFFYLRRDGSASAANMGYATHIRVSRRTEGVKDLATAQSSLAAQVAEIDGIQTAQAEALTEVEASVGEATADGLLRVTVKTTPTDALSRIGIAAAASAGEGTDRSAAMFLEAIAGNLSQVLFNADRVAFINGSARHKPFVFMGGNLYLGGDVSVEGDLLVGGSVKTGAMQDNAISVDRRVSSAGGSDSSADWTQVFSLSFTPYAGSKIVLALNGAGAAVTMAEAASPLRYSTLQIRYLWRGAVIRGPIKLMRSVSRYTGGSSFDVGQEARVTDGFSFDAGANTSGTLVGQIRRQETGTVSLTDITGIVTELKK